jgi:hypothetical protein
MSNTPPLVAAAPGVPQRADPLPLAPAMTVAGQGTNPLARESAARGAEQVARVALTK